MRSSAMLLLLGALGAGAVARAFAAPPNWVAATPPPDAESTYVAGAGSSATGDAAEAEERARTALLDALMRQLGIEEPVAPAAAALADEERGELRRQLAREGSGRIVGLAVADRYVESGASGVTVHLLARYVTADLLREKDRLARAVRQQEVEGLERKGEGLVRSGRLFEAVLAYLEAAAAAARPGASDTGAWFARAMDEARTALERISLVKLNDELSTAAGTVFAEPFRVKAVSGAKAADPPVPEVTLAVTWADWRSGARQAATARLRTAEDGVAAFLHPAPGFVGAETLTMAIDLAPSLSALDGLPEDQQRIVAGFADLAARKLVAFRLESYSPARDIESAAILAALDANGAPLAGQEFAAGLLKPLAAAKFRLKALALDPAVVAASTDAQLVLAASQQGGETVRRVFYGTARLESVGVAGDAFTATASGTVKVADVKTGVVLLSVTRTCTTSAANGVAASSAALAQLGEDIGQEIASRLR